MKKKGIKDNHALQAYFHAPAEDPSEARQEDDRMGRDPATRAAEGCRDSLVARHAALAEAARKGTTVFSRMVTTSI